MANLGGRSSAQRFVTRPGGVSPASRIAGSPIYIELTRSRQPAPRVHPGGGPPESLDDHMSRKSSRFGRCAAPLPRSVPESRARLEAFSIPDVLQPAPSARRREDALAYVRALVTTELNASDSNPIVLPVESAPAAVAN